MAMTVDPTAQPPARRNNTRLIVWITVGVASVCVVCAGVMGGLYYVGKNLPTPAPSTSSRGSVQVAQSAPPATLPASPAALALTGFGATEADWRAHHRLDELHGAGRAYDPDPSLPQVNGHVGDRYILVQIDSGRVDGYTLKLVHSALAAAIDAAKRELPADATVVWQRQLDLCYQIELSSAAVGKSLAPLGDGQGMLLVEFESDDIGGQIVYNANDITSATFSAVVFPTAADGPPC